MKKAVVPEVTVMYFKEGEHCTNAMPGDLILVQHSGLMPSLIRFGQKIKYWAWRTLLKKKQFSNDYCKVNHAMIVVYGGKDSLVSQMEAKGGTITHLKNYVDKAYAVVHITNVSDEQRIAAARFAQWCEGIAYGWFSILGCVIDILLPTVELSLGSGQRMICSTASSLALRCCNFIPDRSDVSVLPADLARYFDVKI